ncbi:MAG: alkaline phosphatase family protein [Methanosarcinales archaeon]
MEKNRVLVIGLDGATPELVFPWAKEGKLPNIAKLIDGGASGNLASTIPPVTAPAWVSFMTGKNPGKHGIVDFILRKQGTYDTTDFDTSHIMEGSGVDLSVVNAAIIDSKKIWNILSDHNKKVGLLHVPITYPPEEVNGFMVSGLGTPGPKSNFTYPQSLRKKLLEDFGYKIHITELDVENNEDVAIKDLHETEQKRAEVAISLMNSFEWDFFMVVFEGTDFVQHFFWKHTDPSHPAHNPEKAKKYKDAILNCYQKLDNIIGEILKNVNENTTVIIMSDHGGGSLIKKFCINKWLMYTNLLKLKKESKIGLNKEKIKSSLIKLGLKSILKKIPKNIRESIPDSNYTISDFDWTATKAYSCGGWSFIYINLEGREVNGIVKQGSEYEDLRNYIIKELYNLKDPITKKNIVEKVYKREEIYHGESLDKLPDLIVITDESIDCEQSIPKNDSLFVPPPIGKSGNHRKNGIVIINGKNIQKGILLENAEIIDLAPTILYIMDVPLPHDMDGKILKDAFNPNYYNSKPVLFKDPSLDKIHSDSEWTREDEEKVKERLRGLGYIESTTPPKDLNSTK